MGVTKVFTLIFVKTNNKVLLGYKTRGLGAHLWNGFGGKVEQGETILNGAIRELNEESHITQPELKHLGVVRYEEIDQDRTSIVHIFMCNKFSGVPSGSEEMNPVQWFTFKEIPFDHMWPDAEQWLQFVLNEEYFHGNCIYFDHEISKLHVEKCNTLEQALSILN